MEAISRFLRQFTGRHTGESISSESIWNTCLIDDFRQVLHLETIGAQREYVAAFENEFASWCGAEYVKSVNSGTSALFFALRALGIGQGDEVITVANTWISTITAIEETGARCRFVDIDIATGQMDPRALPAAIGKRTRAIVPVHMYGGAVPMEDIIVVARNHGLAVIEDACQAIGARVGNRKVGTLGDIGCYSFHTNKLVGAPADGGMLVTNRQDMAKYISGYVEASWPTALTTPQPRIPSRLPPLAIPVLRAKLRILNNVIQAREAIYGQYRNGIDGLPHTHVLAPAHNTTHSYRHCVFVSQHANAIQDILKKSGIHIGPLYRQSVDFFERFAAPTGGLPNTDFLLRNHLTLPMGDPSLVEKVIDAIRSHIGRAT